MKRFVGAAVVVGVVAGALAALGAASGAPLANWELAGALAGFALTVALVGGLGGLAREPEPAAPERPAWADRVRAAETGDALARAAVEDELRRHPALRTDAGLLRASPTGPRGTIEYTAWLDAALTAREARR